MAVTFSDLHTEAGLKSLESFLTGKTYISGSVHIIFFNALCISVLFTAFVLCYRNQITKDDVKVFAAVFDKPSADLYPSASKWYDSVASKLSARFVPYALFHSFY